jgi:hypothetical protein
MDPPGPVWKLHKINDDDDDDDNNNNNNNRRKFVACREVNRIPR